MSNTVAKLFILPKKAGDQIIQLNAADFVQPVSMDIPDDDYPEWPSDDDHLPWCNADHSGPVGVPGCVCEKPKLIPCMAENVGPQQPTLFAIPPAPRPSLWGIEWQWRNVVLQEEACSNDAHPDLDPDPRKNWFVWMNRSQYNFKTEESAEKAVRNLRRHQKGKRFRVVIREYRTIHQLDDFKLHIHHCYNGCSGWKRMPMGEDLRCSCGCHYTKTVSIL